MRNPANHPQTLAALDAARAVLDAGGHPGTFPQPSFHPLATGMDRQANIRATRDLILDELTECAQEDIRGRLEWARNADEAALVLLDHLSVMVLLEDRGALKDAGPIGLALAAALDNPAAWWLVPAWFGIVTQAGRLRKTTRETYEILVGLESCSRMA